MDGRLHVAIGRHHQAHGLRRELERPVNHRHPILARHPQVGQHGVWGDILHEARRFRGILRHEGLILILERGAQAISCVLLVVNNQNGRFHGVPVSGLWVAPQTRAAFSVSAVRARATSAKRACKLAFATAERSSRSQR